MVDQNQNVVWSYRLVGDYEDTGDAIVENRMREWIQAHGGILDNHGAGGFSVLFAK